MDKYRCHDCEKELPDLHFNEETKKKRPRDMDGAYIVICNDCKHNEDY